MTTVKVSTTDEMLALLPHQVGHRISRSLTVTVVSGGLLGPVARIDLPPERDVRPTARLLLEGLLRVAPEAALVVGHESVPGESRSLLQAVHRGLRSAGVGIIDHVVVRDGRWWGWCCRPADELDGLLLEHIEGHPVPDDFEVPAVAELIVRGSAPLGSRDEVGALVAEDPARSASVGGVLERLAEGDAGCEVERRPELWARVLDPEEDRRDGCAASDEELAHMVRSLVDKAWRDALVAWMSPVMFPLDKVDDVSTELLRRHVRTGAVTTSEHSEMVLRRLLAMTTRVPDTWPAEAAALCTVAGCVAWGVGNGSTAGDAVERALRVHPGYTLAGYLVRMVEHQLRPRHRWGEVAA
ncbi:DUF4192 domain-containing protein [Knoellia sp. CPCC 206450]|uniref:DUF4192 domain-containing protein n=1 Tax=Knoellia tibetensis TaxID=3404798 RepID=UPI003B438EBE